MSSLEKFLTAVVGVALVTTLVLPKHKGPGGHHRRWQRPG
jgi:hypothetical protein